MCLQWSRVLYHVIISQFNSPCNEFTSAWPMCVNNIRMMNVLRTSCKHFKRIYPIKCIFTYTAKWTVSLRVYSFICHDCGRVMLYRLLKC